MNVQPDIVFAREGNTNPLEKPEEKERRGGDSSRQPPSNRVFGPLIKEK